MNLYTFYTPSHKSLYEDYFLKTLPKDEFNLIVRENPQECPTGNYYSLGWRETVFKKIDLLIEACKKNWGGFFAYSDVDVQFFGLTADILLTELGTHDIACQYDMDSQYCAGFFVCRANQNILDLLFEMRGNYGESDQPTLNAHIYRCDAGFLSHRFYTAAHSLGGKIWEGQDIDVPPDVLIHHANWVIGVAAKRRLMDVVRQKFCVD